MKRSFYRNITSWNTTDWASDLNNRDKAIKQNVSKYRSKSPTITKTSLLNSFLICFAIATTVILIGLLQYV